DSPTPQDEGHRRYATKLAETLISVLAQDTAEGRCFRVDMRLRPEGRFGALVRSYAAFREYYDRWAETWERQALIKARPVAGDLELGERFIELTRGVAYRRLPGETLVRDVREMRDAVERKLEAAGERDRHVKEGRGTLRDVEFTIQPLQLLFGAERPELRAPDTLTALARLEEAGLLAPEERQTFEDGYRFFREVEHRLQIMQDLPVRLVPEEPRELRRLARSMGFAEAEPFLAAYRAKSDAVEALSRAIFQRLGAGGPPEDPLRAALLAAETEDAEPLLLRELERRRYPEPDQALEALVRLAAGEPGYRHPAATRRLFADLAPGLLEACGEAADPTEALRGMAEFAERKLLHRALYQSLLEHPEALWALCRFAGGAPAAMRSVLRYPELSDLVTDTEALSRRRTAPAMREALERRLTDASGYERRLSALRRFRLRELVRMAARRVLCPVPVQEETAEWSDLADTLLEAALRVAVERLREQERWPAEDAGEFAVFALGRYGGRELQFASDLDLLYAYRSGEALRQQQYELLAKTLGDVLQAPTEEGRLFEIDLRLRPEGRQGFSVLSLEGARRYYGEGGRGETWELQMLTRLRFVCGNGEVARELEAIVGPRVYREPMPPEWTERIRAMKRRMERERVSDSERERNLKLGPGGLSDVEFLVQYLQLREGGARPELRVASTVAALGALGERGVLQPDEAEALRNAYERLTDARQALTLLLPQGSADRI
ncbi:MAG TPA: hypothetical protein VFU47_02225, partial [Armatimonadota bacterium]|nr:hypothetical protein [Armatimonadota bacterium]